MKWKAAILLLWWLVPQENSAKPGKTGENIIIVTEMGEIRVKLDPEHAPVTTLNFIRYVEAGLFDTACFYRVVRWDNQPQNKVKIEVIQGGRYREEEAVFPPIIHETTLMTGIRHRKGTISMARNQPGTATSEFFICLGAQPELDYGGERNPDGQGFAAFGKVTRGMKVVRRIHGLRAPGQYLDHPVKIKTIQKAGK